MAIKKERVIEILRLNPKVPGDRENEEIEFKEQFNLAGLADYLKDFAAFANNQGGYLVFGVKDSPRILKGLNNKSIKQFQRVDPEKITTFLLELFSPNIRWEQTAVEMDGKIYGVFKIEEVLAKPVIAKKDRGSIKNGEIYYRYAGRTQKIQYAELEAIIQRRIREINNRWIDLMSKIAEIGPQNAAVLNMEGDPHFEAGDAPVLTIDEELVKKIKVIRDGDVSAKEAAEPLKLVGDVRSVIGVFQENFLMKYPLSATELAIIVKKKLPSATHDKVWRVIKENQMKDDPNYSAYNFRNKKQEELYKASGKLPNGTPSIYNHNAVDFIVTDLKSQEPTPQANDQDR